MSNKKDSLGDRMKGYESVPKISLTKRIPVIIRIDGKAFHTFTRGFVKPFDQVLVKSMQETAKYLCEHIQGCVFAYTQSDEITLVLCDYQTLTTSGWFDYEVQKLCSISASMATAAFTKFFGDNMEAYVAGVKNLMLMDVDLSERESAIYEQYRTYEKAFSRLPMFDSRCFNVPLSDVTNCILWRQKDAERNSIQMVGQCNFSHKELQNKSCNMIQDMLFKEKGINWNDFPTHLKRGSAVIKNEEGKWFVDTEMPILTQDRDYIEKRINFE